MRLRNISSVVVSAVAAVVLSCCGRVGGPSGDTVATVGESVLTRSDVAAAVPAGLDENDSVAMADSYVEEWTRREVKLQEAERVLALHNVDIEAMVEDYRNSLLSYRLDRYYVDGKVDTVISDSLVAAYYTAHKPEFRMDRDIVKGRVARLPRSFNLRTKLKNLMGSSNAERQQDFLDMTVKNGLQLTVFDRWTGFDELLGMLPVVRGQDYSYLLKEDGISELMDDNYRYYIQITDHVSRGEQAPLEWVEEVVRNIIYNDRSSRTIRMHEDSLYRAAVDGGLVRIYSSKNRN